MRPGRPAPFTPRAKKVLELALREALQLNHSYIGTEHILLGLVREGDGVAATVLAGLGVDLGRVRQAVNDLMTGGPEAPPAGASAARRALAHRRRRGSLLPALRRQPRRAARFRTMAMPADDEDADPLSVSVVYCVPCGTTLHMFARRPELGTEGGGTPGQGRSMTRTSVTRSTGAICPYCCRSCCGRRETA